MRRLKNPEKIPYWEEIQRYVQDVVRAINPKLILLYGSISRGTFGIGSDVDLLIIADNLPKNPNERLKLLYSLDRTKAPLDPKAYTPSEALKMLRKGHPLLMDALEDGIILYADEDYFRELVKAFQLAKRRYQRFERGWIRMEG
ncbi:nucleotidyltransferase domain-containing protein [Thermococcus sp. AM4]|jgi:predicted nucleotidyltransferase|uniref:nucleotidyltransferase domain-containing protein n=1 Tax=Thermococcus sp. (strain AM4) TaxID=246969 RepID=UPI000187080B|nr:nucleotidyltransferase domain-containing protein [Thermococcus sp. AM4]EEB73057.1 nucleotidyltransferase [Thermococcus sp. AM4]